MPTIVRFRADGRRYGVDVAAVGAVLPLEGIAPLPAPRAGVLGVLRTDDDQLTVIAPFGTEGEHVLVLLGDGHRFGLVVEEVERVTRIAQDAVAPAPEGQDAAIVVGIAGDTMLLDPRALESHLGVSA